MSRCNTAHPLYTRSTNIFGASISEADNVTEPYPDTTRLEFSGPSLACLNGKRRSFPGERSRKLETPRRFQITERDKSTPGVVLLTAKENSCKARMAAVRKKGETHRVGIRVGPNTRVALGNVSEDHATALILLQAADRDFQSNCWASVHYLGQLSEFQCRGVHRCSRRPRSRWGSTSSR